MSLSLFTRIATFAGRKARFIEAPEKFSHQESHNQVPFIQEASGVHTSSFIDSDELKMALRPEKFPGLLRNRLQPEEGNNVVLVRDVSSFPGKEMNA